MSRRPRPLALAPVVAALALGLLAGLARAQDALPPDPALAVGSLDNGLAYVIRKHDNPPGRLGLWLHVHSGSLNEADATRGIAHYLEHMAFNGSANFPPGSLIPLFQSLGMTFGRDQNAFTGLDQTTYTLSLPDTRPETLDRGLLFLSDVALRLSLAPKEIDAERQVILEEKRTRAGARQRLLDYIYERIAPESTIGRRLPIGTEATIRAVGPQDFRDYYARWYVPSNMTLIAVGDVEPAALIDAIRRHFGAGPVAPRPVPVDPGVRATSQTRAIVASDPDLTRASVSVVRVEPPRGPVLTQADLRRDLVEYLAKWMFNRRLERRLAEGRVSFLEASASTRDDAGAIRYVSVTASGPTAAWQAMLAELGAELQQARLHGFAAAELALAGTSLLSDTEEAARQEATLPARSHLRRINGAVSRREPVVAAARRLDLFRGLLPGVTPREVSDAFAAVFDPTHVVFVLELPSSVPLPSEAELITLGRAAVDVRPDPRAETTVAAALLAVPPRPGRVVEGSEHAASGVYSAWLDNGLRVHHRFVDQRKNDVGVVITLAGGRIQETAATRGLTEAATLAWGRPATSRLGSTQIRDLMTGKKIRVDPGVQEDGVTLGVFGDPADLEAGLELAHALLTDPLLEAAVLDQWKQSSAQRIAARKLEPNGVLAEAVAQALYPAGDARLHPLEIAQVERITRDEAQAWLTRLIATAPIEVVVVGDLDRARALALVEAYLGSLPARDRISDKTLTHLRRVARGTGPIRVARTFPARTPRGLVLDGFFGPDLTDLRDSRLLTLASRVMSTRMNRVIREEKQLVYSIGAGARPGTAYPGLGSFGAQAPTDPAKVGDLVTAIDELYLDFATRGPDEDELAVAKRQIANQLDEEMRTAEFWRSRLANLDYRGLTVDDLVGAPAAYQAPTTTEVREAFARYWRPDASFQFVITPAP